MAKHYYGIDIGDGETAVAYVRQGTSVEPYILQIRAKENLVTALGIGQDGTRYIGEEAFQVADIGRLHLRFKSQYLTNPASHQWLEDFARTLLETLQQEGHLDDPDEARFFVGCPSGWDDHTRDGYRQLLLRAGYKHVEVVSESRAALVYAREAGELRVTSEQLYSPTLIIDAGSSTTDYTFVSSLEELQLGDTGEVALGAGIIDRLLLEANVDLHPERDRLRSLLRQYPALESRCEMEARRLKERYFDAQRRGSTRTYPCESSIRLYTDPEIRVDMLCTDEMMDRLLSTPLEILGGKSYLQAYRASLRGLLSQLSVPPSLILMTGGAMRMPFMREIAAEVFPDASIVQGNNPEFAIARGLCYALRMEERRQGFLQDVDGLIRSDAVETVVADALKPLFASLAPLVVDEIVDVLIPSLFTQWRKGGIKTLNQLMQEIEGQAPAFIRSGEMREKLRPVIAAWLNTLRPKLEEITNPICDRYAIPRTSLRLPNFVEIGADLPLDAGGIINFDTIKIIIDVIVAIIIAMLAGGTGTALITTGPIGWVIGLLVGSITAWIGVEFAEKLLMDADIPGPMRVLIGRSIVTGKLAKRKNEMTSALTRRLEQDVDGKAENVTEMVDAVAKTIEQQLQSEMETAILLIR